MEGQFTSSERLWINITIVAVIDHFVAVCWDRDSKIRCRRWISRRWHGTCIATFSIWVHEHECSTISLPVVCAVVPDQRPSMNVLQIASMIKV